MLVDPSPKVQDQAVGLPVEVSVKDTVWPVVGTLGAKVKAVVGAGVVDPPVEGELPPPLPQSTCDRAMAAARTKVAKGFRRMRDPHQAR